MRTALLRAVSHDLRSPPAGTAAVSGLRVPGVELTAADRDKLLDTAAESLEQLSRLAGSLLDLTRLQARFYQNDQDLEKAEAAAGRPLNGEEAEELGLVTFAPDEIDWDDEVRVAIEARAAFSPDAMTGLEANLRFAGPETMETKIFGRLTAWQNWIFQRPNAVGDKGALKVYGQQGRAEFDWKRT